MRLPASIPATHVLLALLVAAAGIRPVQAAAGDPPSRLPPIVVIAGPAIDPFESDADATGFTSVIDTREAWRGYETVADVLDHSVGVQVRRFGGGEDFATASVRGSTPGQVKILLDGVSLSRADNQIVNLADLPLDSVERIEVYRGFTPVRYASSGAASVINIVTRKPKKRSAGAAASFGSFTTAKASLHGSAPVDGGTAAAFFTFRTTEGDFEYVDDLGTEQNPADDVTRDRDNNDRDSYDLLLRWRQDLETGASLTATTNVFYKDEGIPGLGSNRSDVARFEETRVVLSSAWENAARDTALSFDFTYLGERLEDPPDPDADDGSPTAGLGYPYDVADSRTAAFSTDAHRSLAWGDWHLFEGSIEGAFEIFRGRFPGSAIPPTNPERATLAVALGDEIYVEKLRLSLSPQVRYESIWNSIDEASFAGLPTDDPPPSREDSVDPRLGLRWEPLASLAIKGNIGTYFRPPNFGELFGDQGFSTSNPALRAEQGVNRDLGFVWRPGAVGPLSDLGLEYAYFNNDADDMIVFVQTGARIAKPLNTAKARVRGHELRAHLQARGGFSLELNYTLQDTENLTAGNRRGNELAALPEHEVYARVACDRRRWSLAYELEYRSRVFLDPDNVRSSPGFAEHAVELTLRPWASALELKIEGDNLGDEQNADVFGYPVPGRAFFLTLSYELSSD